MIPDFTTSDYRPTDHFYDQKYKRKISWDEIGLALSDGHRVKTNFHRDYNDEKGDCFAVHKWGVTVILDKKKKRAVTVYREEKPESFDERLADKLNV